MKFNRNDVLEIVEAVMARLELGEEDSIEETVDTVVRDGKVVKVKKKVGRKRRMTAKQKAALKKARAKAHSGSAKRKRAKSMALRARKVNEGITLNVGVGAIVVEAFDIMLENGKSLAVESNFMLDVYDVNESVVAMDIYDEDGDLVHEGVEVDAEFVGDIYEENLVESLDDFEGEGVIEDNDFDDEESRGELSYDEDAGYIATLEGKQLRLGNRVRAKAFLISEGVMVGEGLLDDVMDGMVFKIK